jgi:transposase
MEFRELSDEQWEFIKPHLPPQPITGRKRADDRKVLNGILFVLIVASSKQKKGRKFRLQRSQEKKWNKDSCLCKL